MAIRDAIVTDNTLVNTTVLNMATTDAIVTDNNPFNDSQRMLNMAIARMLMMLK